MRAYFTFLIAILFLCPALGTPPLLADDTPAPKPLRLRVLSYNIHHGAGMDGKIDLTRIADVIKKAEADLVALQEVDVKTTRVRGVDQAGELAKLTGLHHLFGKAIDFAGGDYGQAVLSRWPIEKSHIHRLPAIKGESERRIALETTVPIPGIPQPLRFITTHLDHVADNTDRLVQCKKLNEIFAAEDDLTPTLLAGDMNAQPHAEEMKLIAAKWSSAAAAPGMKGEPTYPSDKPRVQIDYVLLRPAGQWRVIEVTVIEEKIASDHRPLLAVLEYIPAN